MPAIMAKQPSRRTKATRRRPAAAGKPSTQAAVAGGKSARPRAVRGRESLTARRARTERILAALKASYADATCALHHRDAYELLVATILSAQCTDERVNQVTPNLFRKYPDAAALAQADPEDLTTLIKSTGFFRNKTRSLLGMAQRVVAEHDGAVPDNMPDLLQLPGVARKTANCVLGAWFGQNEGIVVDTHVGRLALRLRLLMTAKNDKDAVRIEQDLMQLVPREDWTWLSHALIEHGRRVCTARKPRCGDCVVQAECPSAFQFD